MEMEEKPGSAPMIFRGLPSERSVRRTRPLLLGLVLGVALLGLAGRLYGSRLVRYQAYELGYMAGQQRAAVESWSLPLPLGYQLVYWKSTPHSGQDGLRLFAPADTADP
jgi:hypothetical protein